jgi:histone acetyltransferase 1
MSIERTCQEHTTNKKTTNSNWLRSSWSLTGPALIAAKKSAGSTRRDAFLSSAASASLAAARCRSHSPHPPYPPIRGFALAQEISPSQSSELLMMATASEQWSSDANEAVQISLVIPGPKGPQTVHEFHPTFTYPIFGEEERIFGYKGLHIDIRFAADEMRPNVFVSYDKKFTPVGDTVALDILSTLKEWLPHQAFTRSTDFETQLEARTAGRHFVPPGKLVQSYSRKGKTFDIWAGSLLDPAVRETVERMQILISFFIEAGTPINTQDADWTLDRWTIYFVYEKISAEPSAGSSHDNLQVSRSYSFIGYSTTYRFFSLKPASTISKATARSDNPTTKLVSGGLQSIFGADGIAVKDLPACVRLSQFLILPPYQKSGHGSALYSAIYADILTDPTVRELAVEDPSEEFDVLRDINDWRTLEPKFREAKISINVEPFSGTEKRRIGPLPTAKLLDAATLKKIRADTKIARRQFARQLEMYLLSLIPFSHRAAGGASLTKLLIRKTRATDPADKAYYWWRLILKQRIYKKNKDQLQQLDLEERRPKVEDAARAQEDEYEKLLLTFAALASKDLLQNGSRSQPVQERKRKIIEDDEDEDETDDETKKQKI